MACKLEDFDEAKCIRLRAVAKRKMTILENAVNNFDAETTSVYVLKTNQQILPSIWEQYDEVQTFLEINFENSDSHADDRTEFTNRYVNITAKLADLIKEYDSDNTSAASSKTSVSTASNNQQPLQLPALNLPSYSGIVTDWLEYKNVFTALIIENDNLKDIQKLFYLKSSLKGQAKELIESFTLSNKNFKTAWELLCERYDNCKVIINHHIKNLLNLPSAKSGTSDEYRNLINYFSKNKSAAETLLKLPLVDALLMEIILDRIKLSDRSQWESSTSENDKANLKDLIQFIENKAKSCEIVEYSNKSAVKKSDSKVKANSKTLTTTASVACVYCNKTNHMLPDCYKFKQLSLSDKRDFLKKKSICFACLLSTHRFKFCKGSCSVCGSKHHSLLHDDRSNPQSRTSNTHESDNVETYVGLRNNTVSAGKALLPTVILEVKDCHGNLIKARALLDSGSQTSFMTSNLSKRLKLPVHKTKFTVSGISDTQAANIVHTCLVEVRTKSKEVLKVSCAVLERITGHLPPVFVNCHDWNLPRNITLADPNFNQPSDIDLLLGAEVFSDVILNDIKKRKGFPTLISTKFGFIVSGQLPLNSCRLINTTVSCLTRTELLDHQLRRFWELEELNHIPQTKEDKFCEEHFSENTTRTKDGQFMVRLPIRLDVTIGNSYDNAVKRMGLLEKKFNTNKSLHKDYAKFMDEYLELGHMELAETSACGPEFFIPHHPVFKPSSSSTKMRVVFEGCALSSNNYSLNDILCTGPTVQEDLYSIALRFRKHPVAFTADISKMYRRILVDPRDRSLQKILWRRSPSEELKAYTLKTLTYGTAPASFLATRCLVQLADENEIDYPLAAKCLRSDFYVDDVISGADSIEEAKHLQKQLTDLLAIGCFPLRKWTSSHEEVLENVDPADREDLSYCKSIGENTVQTLGITWDPKNDCFRFPTQVKTISKFTKRNLLSVISSIFDPLGLLAPVVIKCKMLIQKLWALKLSWDEILPIHIQDEWNEIYNNLPCLNKLSVSRKLLLSANPKLIELHGFSDSSELGYGCCIYLRSVYENDVVYVSLVTAKSRVSPVKRQSLPKLELCGALLLSRLLKKVLSSLKLTRLDNIYLWTDSTIVLCWLHNSPAKLKTFVANRVSEIQDDTQIESWNHVSTNENPADYITRGVLPQQLSSLNMWWQGPPFLHNAVINIAPFNPRHTSLPEIKESQQETSSILCCTSCPEFSGLNEVICKYSSVNKLIRIVAYVLRFISYVRNSERKQDINLTISEIERSRTTILRLVQYEVYKDEIACLKNLKDVPNSSKLKPLHPFLDKDGLLRVGGRLENSELNFDAKHQILLPPKHHVSQLLIQREHETLLHAGLQSTLSSLRRTYWFPAGRNTVKKILMSCVTCFKVKKSYSTQLMGQLPSARVRPSFPFECTGVDYCGPILLKRGIGRSKLTCKAYIALFVCLCTKSVHLELVTDLTSTAFIAALRRFTARRGKCQEIVSDNGTNFVGAAAELKRFLQDTKVQSDIVEYGLNEKFHWKFISPKSPHLGGLWESEIKSMKAHIKKVIGNTLLSYEEYCTLLCLIESCLNSRPLCSVPDEPNTEILTPGHFLIGRPLNSISEPSLTHIPINRLSRWQHIQRMAQHFWARWSADYLTTLQKLQKWSSVQRNFQVNDIVLIKEDHVPPLCWRVGRVVATHPGADGLVRVVSIKTSNGVIKRPIVKLCLLPNQ